MLSAYLIKRILRETDCKNTNLYYFLTLCFVPVFLYINHVYSDLLFSSLCLLGVFIYIRNYRMAPVSFAAFAIAYFLRPLSAIFAIAVIIDLALRKRNRRFVTSILSVFVFVIVFAGLSLFTRAFLKLGIKSYPVWSFIYIGLNADKIGFMDGTQSVDRKPAEIIQRLNGLGL